MPFARIIASNPSAARYTARTLHEAGYEVEIVPPGTAPNAAEIVFDVDADKMLSITTDSYVPGQREFVLKPLWRKFTAKRKAEEDVARALRAYPRRNAARRPEVVAVAQNSAMAEHDREAIADRQAMEAADFAESQRIATDEKRRSEETERLRAEQAARAQAEESQRVRAEGFRVQQEQEVARQRDIEAQRAELRRQQQARELELARRREREEREMIARKQEEERQRVEALRLEAEETARIEAAYQRRLEEQRAETLRRETMQREADQTRRTDVMRQRQDEEVTRKAEAQRLLLEANMRREESAREREAVSTPDPRITDAAVPTFGQYLGLRMQQWRDARAAKSRSKVTPIDRGARSAWRQGWPITAGVAAACLIGWGIASYRDAAPAAVSQPPILAPGQYAPYPVAAPVAAPANRPAHRTKRSAARSNDVALDEVTVHHYYPSKATTAQNQNRKKITDLQ